MGPQYIPEVMVEYFGLQPLVLVWRFTGIADSISPPIHGELGPSLTIQVPGMEFLTSPIFGTR